jgi:hypothetical protein
MPITWNPADKNSNIALSNGNLTVSNTNGADGAVRSINNQIPGKYYFEVTWTGSAGGGNTGCGIATNLASLVNFGQSAGSGIAAFQSSGNIWNNGSSVGISIGAFASGTVCVAIDTSVKRAWFRKDAGLWNANATYNPATNVGGIDITTIVDAGILFAITCINSVSPIATANFGATAFTQAVPVGFVAWDTTPTPGTDGAHRYWRLLVDAASQGNGALGIGEIQYRTTAGSSLVFSGGAAFCSSSYPNYYPIWASDNNNATFWAGADGQAWPQWWAYDLGASPRKVVEITITSRPDSFWTQAPTVFTPQWSDDGFTWTSMHTLTAVWTAASQTQVFAVTDAQPGLSLTTLAVEEWGIGSPPVQLTTIAVEQWGIGSPPALATQVAVEQWADGNPRAQVTQVALEQWSSVANLTPTSFSARFV